MSPDDIFAAQLWAWPDPAIKRDMEGRVLFVNAAFLQLYGGTVQDWTGNAVGGWPAPQGPGQPYRFETRMPMTADASEQVYDWLEMTLADGHAFALARNITVFMQPSDPQPGAEIPAQMLPDAAAMAAQNAAMQAQTVNIQAATTHVPETAQMAEGGNNPQADIAQPYVEAQNLPPQEPVIPETAPAVTADQEPTYEPIVFAEFKPEDGFASEQETVVQTPEAPAVVPEIQTPAAESVSVEPDMTTNPQVATSNVPSAALELNEDPTQERAYERRALPIENESAVLGNNWRDAVIAKAVGADNVPSAETPPPAPAVDTSDSQVGPKRILLAEDNAINALLTRTLLEAEGHTVETVQDGQLAVEAMKTSTYDLIFMDMRMPNMDGLEATRKIRTLPNVRKDLPIIALTANAFDDDRNACFDSGMNDFRLSNGRSQS